MILDSSAIVAIAFREPAALRLAGALLSADRVGVAAPTWVETSMVLASSALPDPRAFLADFGREFRVESIPFDAEHGRAAADAFIRFGKGRHPARLNYADCMSYAAAKVSGWPLLFVGDDFSQTDIEAALH